ncbi:MAG TPA: hypothetical protein VGP13_03765 [Candidatus Paceibacterota bacterium]|jgi:hypothetical protein|nr:hypothetical protein [Candidatus Paceibacterota bacterium]
MTLSLSKRIAGGAVGLAVGTLLALAAPLTYAQTTDTTTDTTVTTPGVPSTGAGGEAASNVLVLGASAVVLVAGGAYLLKTRKQA